jgi:hypothetical protein
MQLLQITGETIAINFISGDRECDIGLLSVKKKENIK